MRVKHFVMGRGVHVLSALAFLVLFAGAASGALQQDETVTIHVSDARPLASAIKEIEDRYGWVITYEDPRYVDASDVEDVTWRRKDLDFTKKVLAPRGGPFSFRYPVPAGVDAPDASALLGKLLEEYHRTGYPGVFRLARTGSVFHIVPSASRNTLGQLEPWSSPLNARISIANNERTAFDMLEAIAAAVSRSGSVKVGVASAPLNLMMGVRVQGGARNERARSVLLRTLEAAMQTLEATNQRLSWTLLCVPVGTWPEPVCGLNVHFVGSRVER